jgi:hypothetical protein
MTLSDYLSAECFPATTQAGLSASQQMKIDAFNYDQLKEHLEDGGTLSKIQRAIWRELKERYRHSGNWRRKRGRRRREAGVAVALRKASNHGSIPAHQ